MADAVRRFGLARADFDAVIDGMAMDVERDIRWPTAAELDLYCDRVASAVGRLSVRVFGMDEAPGRALAYHLGRALQLTNILRDIDEDAGIGRVYLPLEGLTGAGIAITTPTEVTADPRIDLVARTLAAEAEGHYARGAGDPGAATKGSFAGAAADGGGLWQGAGADEGDRLAAAAHPCARVQAGAGVDRTSPEPGALIHG